MKKTLLQIGSSLNCGAPGKISEQIGLLARDSGWDVYMAHGIRHSNQSQLKTMPMATSAEEKVHALYSMLLDSHGLGPSIKTRKLVEWIHKQQPDVIHMHNLHGYFLNYKTLFEYLMTVDIPIVWTFHDLWPITGHCAYFDFNNCDKWKYGCSNCKFHNEYPSSFIDLSKRNYQLKKRLFTGVKNMTLVPVSDWVGDVLSQSFLNKYPVHRIYNGVDIRIFSPCDTDLRARMNMEGKHILLGVASPWGERKGFRDYIKLRRVLSDDFVIIMVGLTSRQISTLPSGIIGIGRTQSQTELAEYYNLADITLNLSYQETFGMTTVEGMSCGTPGIVYDRTASPELVTPETGIVVEAGNIEQLATAVIDMTKQGKNAYSQACRKRVEEHFDKDKCFEEYIRLYDNLLGK